jgi:putative hydrolase of the HAD superfamily
MDGSMPQVKIANMKIEAILFDLGKVIVDFDFEAMFRELCGSCSKPAEEFEKVFVDPEWAFRYERGLVTTREFYEHLCNCGGLEMELSDFRRIWSSIFAKELLVSEDLLRELKQRYPLILVSNTNEAHADHIRQNYSILDYFDEKIFSFEVGCMKPDRRIYECAIEASGKPAEALFFTDDRPENIEGARQLGIRAHQFRSESDLIAALQGAGVEVGDVVERNPLGSRSRFL